MRYLLAAAFAAALLSTAQAQMASCKAAAADKKLAGAALKSFMTKCENDAKNSCTMAAKDKKLAGAAEKSFTTKCVNDKVGTK